MAAAAAKNASAPILKLKLGGDELDLPRVEAVRREAPAARLFVDANESWSAEHYQQVVSKLKELQVELIEQPFPANADHVLATLPHPVAVCADESCHTTTDLRQLKGRYEIINVKLDKTGGLAEALRLCASARENGFKLLVGCMVGTSLSMAPARVLASIVDYVDLDGPLLLARDRDHGLIYRNGRIDMPTRELWG
jgi:L-Ala-D/L-Glu epimerase